MNDTTVGGNSSSCFNLCNLLGGYKLAPQQVSIIKTKVFHRKSVSSAHHSFHVLMFCRFFCAAGFFPQVYFSLAVYTGAFHKLAIAGEKIRLNQILISQMSQSFHLDGRKPTIYEQHTLPASSAAGKGTAVSVFTRHSLAGANAHVVPRCKPSSLSCR